MGKSYKQNDRHFQKNGRGSSKTSKNPKRINFDKIKNIIRDQNDDILQDMRGLK